MSIKAAGSEQENKTAGLSEGQIIFLATDGVWGAENIDGEMFGKDRIYDLIPANAALSAKGILNILLDMLYRFTKGRKFEDDVILVVIKIEVASKPRFPAK